MGYETQLIFNNIDVPRDRLVQLRDAARKLLRQDIPWAYMLNYIYAESSDGDAIDLQISKDLKRALSKINGEPPVPLNKLIGKGDHDIAENEDEPWYFLQWYPYDIGDGGKWYHTDEFVAWISPFCTSGHMFQLVHEENGGLWGWEFNDGNYRDLEMQPKGCWKHPCHLRVLKKAVNGSRR